MGILNFPRTQKPPVGTSLNHGDAIADSVVAFWAFNGSLYDSSLYGNHASFFGDADWKGGAIDFPGSNDAVRIVDGIPPIGNNLSVVCRFRTTDAGSNSRALFGGDNRDNAIHIRLFGTRVDVYEPGTIIAQSTASGISVNTWHQLVYTRNGTGSGTHNIYVDGVDRVLSTDAAGNFSDVTEEKWIGAQNGVSEDFLGQIDYVIIFNRALTPSEVSQLHNNVWHLFEPTRLVFAISSSSSSSSSVSSSSSSSSLSVSSSSSSSSLSVSSSSSSSSLSVSSSSSSSSLSVSSSSSSSSLSVSSSSSSSSLSVSSSSSSSSLSVSSSSSSQSSSSTSSSSTSSSSGVNVLKNLIIYSMEDRYRTKHLSDQYLPHAMDDQYKAEFLQAA